MMCSRAFSQDEMPKRHKKTAFARWVRLVERIKSGEQRHIGIPAAAATTTSMGAADFHVAKARNSLYLDPTDASLSP